MDIKTLHAVVYSAREHSGAASATPAKHLLLPGESPLISGFFVGLAEVSSWDDRRVPNNVSVR